jgi:Uri superfamily endonuclease
VKGSYLLTLLIERPVADLPIGRLGRFSFAAGMYLYVGSALGSGGLAARIAHHRRRVKPHPHWHVDYLRAEARLTEAWLIGCGAPIECPLVHTLAALPGLTLPVPRFGASDSACVSHLLYAPARVRHQAITAAILETVAALGPQPPSVTIEIETFDEP